MKISSWMTLADNHQMMPSHMRNQRPAVYLLAALFLSLVLSSLAACSQKPEQSLVTHSGLTMGTTYTVKWVSNAAVDKAETVAAINRALVEVNQSMSTYIPDSELSLLNGLPAGSSAELSKELAFVLQLGLEISEQSDGAFDFTVGPLVNLWGFGPNGRVMQAPDEEKIAAVMQRVGYQSVELKDQHLVKTLDSYIDLSAIAKGYGVDVIAQLLEARGIDSYLVEIGGELRAKGLKPDGSHWKVAIESPVATTERSIQKIIAVKDIGIATSGDYRNYFEENGVRFSHTIDPITARPIRHNLASVTVLAKTCAEADGYATAMMVMGPVKALKFAEARDIEAFFLVKTDKGFEELMTSGFSKYLVE